MRVPKTSKSVPLSEVAMLILRVSQDDLKDLNVAGDGNRGEGMKV